MRLKEGRVETPFGIGHMVLQRVGSGTDIGLVALIQPGATAAAHAHHVAPLLPEVARDEQAEPAAAMHPTPEYETPAQSGEAPAEFALFDEFAEPPTERSVAPAMDTPSEGVHQAAPEPAETAKSEAALSNREPRSQDCDVMPGRGLAPRSPCRSFGDEPTFALSSR